MGKYPRQDSGNAIHRLVRLGRQSLAVTLSALLFLQPAIANAQSVSASTTAPAANQPTVGAAPNGVPLVDIVTPNGAGLSYNKYTDFNVGTQGLILNNFKGNQGTSSLGGVTPGNPNLNASNPASVILNEVTSGNRSALNGPTEVFGGRADVIVANPNGLTCNGCGFINTPHATLTTGVPNIGADGSLTGFTVNGGDVTFEGAGGNFAAAPGTVDLFDVVARNIHVNAPIYGKTIRLTGGASKYDYATGDSTALTATSGTPEYAIDGTALGAMQADRIKVVVTEKGAGVKMSADMAANAGELSLSADGKISIGNASGRDGVTITSKQKVTAAKVTSQQKLSVRADQGVTLQTVAALSDIVLASGTGLLSVSGDVNSGTTVQMSSDGGIAVGSVTAGNGVATLVATSGDIAIAGAAISTGDLSLTATAGSISAASLQSSQNIALNAALGIAVAGNVQGQGNVNVAGQSISAAKIISGINLVATSADPSGNVVLGAAGDLSLTATGGNITTGNLLSAASLGASSSGSMSAGSVQSTNDLTIIAASLTASGVTSHGALTVNTAGGGVNVSGQALAASNVLISGSALQAGAIAAGVDFAATTANGGGIVLGSAGTLGLTATAGNIVADKLLSAGDLTAQAALLQANNITSHGAVGIAGGVNVANQLLSAGNITINGNANGASAGLLASGVDFAATNVNGGNIVLASSGDLTINDSAGVIQAGTVFAAGTINATGQAVTADTITGHKNITLSGAVDGVVVTSQGLGGGDVSISGSSIKAGTLVSGVDFARTAAANGSIVLAGSGDLNLTSAGTVNASTLLSAGNLNASGSTLTADGITAHGAIMLGGAISVTDQILGSGNIFITGQSLSAQTVVAGIDFDATNRAGGNIALGQSGDLTVSVNGAVAAPTMQAAGVIDVSGMSVAAGSVTGHKGITLSGATTVSGQILGGGAIGISGPGIKAGTIVSGVDFARTAAANGNIIQATSGDLTLASTGSIDVGTLLSAGALSANGTTVTSNAVAAHGDMTLGGAISVTNQILGSGNISITGQSLKAQTLVAGIDFDATNAAGGNIVLGQAGDLNILVSGGVAASTMQAAGTIDASGTTVTADAITGHKDITLSGATTVNHQILGGGNVAISGSGIKAGAIISGVDFARTAAANGNIVLASSGDLTLASAGNIDTGTLLSAGALSVSGAAVNTDAVTAHGDITLSGATTVSGQILGAGNVLISGQSLSAQTVVAGIDFAATNASGGNIVLGQTGDLTALLSGGFSASTMEAAGAININAATVKADTVTGHKDITLAGATTVNGQVLGGGNISVSGASITAGAIVSGVDFAGTAAANGNIVQTASGDISLTSTGNLTVGTLLSAGGLTAQAIDLTASSLTAHGKTALKASGTAASGRVDISGQVLSAGDLTISANSLNAGLLVSGVDFAATSRAGGNIVLGPSGATDLTVSGNATAGTILSAGDFTANVANLQASSITSHGKVGIVGNVDVSNQILAAGDLTISGGSINAPTLISGIDFAATNAASGNIVLASSGAMNLTASGNITAGAILSAGDFTANAADLIANSITAHGNAGIVGNVDVGNQIIAAGNLTVSGGHINAPKLISGIDFAATNATGGGIVLGSSGDTNLTASAGITGQTILSAGNIDAQAATIAANAVTGHGDITLAGSSSVNVTGQLLGAGDVFLSGPIVQLGQAVTGVDFAATARSSNGAIALGPSGDLTINAGSASAGTLIVAGNLNVAASAFTGGNITGHGAVAIGSSTSPGAVKINGQLLGAGNVSIIGSDISGNVIVAGVDFAATGQSATGDVILGQTGDLALTATAGDISFNSLLAAGTITANAANNVSANAVAHGDLALTAGNAITLSGQSLGTGNVNLNARSITIDTLVSGVDFAATNAAANGSLMLRRAGMMTLAASNGSVSANSLLSGGNLAATATQNISYNSLQSLGNAALTSPGAIAYTSTTRVGGNLTLNTGALDLSGSRGSRMAGGGTLIVNASSANLSGSNLVFGGLSLNLTGNADLSNAQVSTVTNAGGSGDIAISAAGGLTTNANTELLAAHDLTLNLPSLGNTGQLAAGNNLTFNVSSDFYNSPSGLVFAGNNANLFVGGTLTNDQGALLAGNGLTIAGPGGGQRNGAVVNSAGLIQSGGSMSILTNGLTNTTTSAPSIQRNVQISNTILSPYDVIEETSRCVSRCNGSGDHDGPTYQTVQTIEHLVSQLISQDQLISGAGASAQIRAGGDLTINATNLWNGYSSIKSDGNMLLTVAGTLTNDGATLNRVTQTICDSSTPCQYYPDVVGPGAGGELNCSGPNRPCIGGNDPTLTYSPNPNGTRDPSRDLNPGSTVSVQAIGAISGVIQARGSQTINGGGAINNVASNGSINGGVVIDAPATANNPLGALGSMTAGGALFNVSAVLSNVAANGGANANSGPSLTGNGPTLGSGPTIGGNNLRAVGASVSSNGVTAATGPSIGTNALTAGSASVNPNSLMGKLTTAIGNSGNLTQILQTNGAELASLVKPQSGGVGGTVPGQVFLFETRAAFLDVSKFYGSAYFIDRIGYTPETKVPFLGDAYFDNQLIDEQMRQLVGNGLGAGSFVPGDNATDQMKTLLDNGVTYAEAHGLGLGQALTPEQAASLTQSMVIYQTEIVDGAPVLVPVVYLSAADRAKTTSAAMIAGNTVSIDAGSVNNSGAIAAADGMTINANSIKANGGAFLAGGNMNLNAENGITLAAQTMNIGGQAVVTANGGVTAGGNLKMDAGAGSLTLSGTKVAAGGSAQLSGQTITLGAVKQDNGGVQTLVGTTVTTGGNLSIAGTNGVNIIASSAKVGGDLSVASSNGSVSIISAGVDNTVLGKDRLNLSQGGTITTTTSQIQQGSSLTSGGTTLISGSQGVLIGGSSLDAGGNLGIVSANGNIAITASQDQTTSQSKTIAGAATGYKGGSSSSTAVTSNGSSITSENGGVKIQADNGAISVIGSDVNAKGGTATLIAKGDVTIGEATDSASSSSKSGSKKASETTTTAQGSSISGQTGVNIGSTAGDVTISASDVTAGDATHTANANISAAGNVVIASGKNTDETTSDSKKSGFLSSSKTHTHTYDEDTVGSSVSASGNVNVAANGEAVVSGSSVAAGGNLALSGSTVTVMGAEEEHESDKQVKKSGIGVGSGGGFISIYGSHSKSITESSTDNVGSALSAANGNITLNATKGDLNIIGSSVSAGQDINLSAARDVNVTPGAESASKSEQDKRSGFGIQLSLGQGSASIGVGYGSSTDKTSKASATNAATTLAAGRDVNINAGNDVNLQAAKVDAGRDANLFAANDVNLLSAEDQTNYAEMHQHLFAGISLTVSSGLISAGQSIASAASNLGGPNSQYALAPTALAGYQTYNTLDKMGLLGGAASQPLASTSLTIGFTSSKTEQSTTVGTPVVTTIDSGRNATIVAKGGDITGRGAQIAAGSAGDVTGGNVLLWAGRNIDLESAQAFSNTSASSQSAGAFLGIDAGGLTAGGSYAKGGEKATGVTQVNGHVLGTGNVTTVSGGDTTLAGAVVSGKSVSTIAGGDLDIVSRQDTATYDEKTLGASLGFSNLTGFSGGVQSGKTKGTYANVAEQSGIVAGDGGYHVTAGGNVGLIGGVIASTAAPVNNELAASSLTFSNLENTSKASTSSYGFGLTPGGIPVPSVGQPAKQSDTGAALATLTPGKLTLSNQTQDLESLNTDLSKANDTVKPFDIDKLKAQQQSAAALSQLANIAIGAIANRFNLADGGVEKTALHAAAGALTALVAGGNVSAGALSGAAQELIGAIVDKALMDNPNLTQEQRNALGQWAATLVGAMTGGMQGAAVALDAEKFNRQLHVKEGDLIKANGARYAVQQGYCQSVDNCSADAIARAQSELTMEALRRVDSTFAGLNTSQMAGAFLDELAGENSAPAGQSLFSATPDQFTNHVLNIEYLSQNKDLYNTFGKSGESKYYTAYVAALVSAANDTADLKNATPAQASAVLNGLRDAIGVVEKGQANATGLENAATGSEQTYLQLLQSLTNTISTTASTNGTALRQFAIQNAALVNGLMANAAFAQSAGKLIQVEYMIAVGGGAALPAAQELAAMCSLGAQACAAQANVIFQSLVDSIPELGGTGVGLAGISAIDKEALDRALVKAAETGPLTSGGMANAATGALLREDLARQAGIPRSIETVWGSSLDDLKASYKMDGWTVTDKAPKASSSGNAQIFAVDAPQGGGPVVKQVQYSPANSDSMHIGQYYKFSYSDGATVKVIDPATYKVTGWPETNTTFYNQAGNKISYDAASNTWSAH